MTSPDCPGESLAGKLLLASPHLQEPTFARTVILLCTHSPEEGAFGLIMNRPLGKDVEELLDVDDFASLRDVPAYAGGPVSQEHLTFASFAWDQEQSRLIYESHLSSQDAVRFHHEGFSVRAFVGYSGWSAGQLESELKQGAWEVNEAVHEIVQAGRLDESFWSLLIRDVSPLHRLEADRPDDVSLN